MAYLTRLQANDDARTEALRALGALLFGIGALVVLVRRGTLDNPWDDLPLLVAWLIPAVVLYGGGIAAARAVEPRSWHSVWVVFGILFVYGTLLQFLTVIDASTDAPLNTVWTLCVLAAAAVLAATFARVRFGWLVAGVALAIAWLSLWDEILENGVSDDAGTFRGLCMIATLLLVAGAWLLENRRGDGEEALELVTAAGLIFLLGAGIVLVGGDLDDDSPAGKVIGWPLILIALAAVAIVASVLVARGDRPAAASRPKAE